MKILSFLTWLIVLAAAPAAPAQTVSVTTLARLGGNPDGFHPQGALVQGGDGEFYGTTEAGGPANFGSIFKIAPDGNFTTIYLFTGGDDGANPQIPLVAGGDGNFYGTTSGTYPLGAGTSGSVYRITPAGVFTTIYRFSPLGLYPYDNRDGGCRYRLLLGKDGFLYGTTIYGGTAEGGGTVFRITLAGVLTTLYSFDSSKATSPSQPITSLVEGNDGNFYGTTFYGGAASAGTFFRVTPNGKLTVLYSFTGSTDGGTPQTALILGSDGNFYGTNNAEVFKLTPAGALTLVHTFAKATEGEGVSALVLGDDHNFYGTTTYEGVNGFGTAFQLTPAGVLTVLYSFNNTGNGVASYGNALAQGRDGLLYGTTQFLGNGDAGTVFQLTTTGSLKTLHLFKAGGSGSAGRLLQAQDGIFYGTTTVGGATGGGTIFSCTPGGVVATGHDFDAATDGSGPEAGLVEDSNGNFFGTTSQGGPMNATQGEPVRPRIDLPGLGGGWYEYMGTAGDNFAFRLIYGWDITYGAGPEGQVIKYVRYLPAAGSHSFAGGPLTDSAPDVSEDLFYGVTSSGGENNEGTVYSITADGTHTVLHQFGSQAGDGTFPMAGLVEGRDGNLYGTTGSGGANHLGTVFSITPAGILNVLHSFAGKGDGATPAAELAQGADGAFYGTTEFSTEFEGAGAVFKISAGGAFSTVHAFATDMSEGAKPLAGLLLATDGNLYGTTSSGGTDLSTIPPDGGEAIQGGTLFSIKPDGTFTNLYGFAGDGVNPAATLIQGADGNLYGTTKYGGADDAGVVFKVALNAVPVATVAATIPTVRVGSGAVGELTVKLSAVQASEVIVNYTVKGTAKNGEDYVMLTGKKKFKPGKTSKPIKIDPLGDLEGAASKTVKITLEPATGYTVGTAASAKVKILGGG